MREVRWWLVSGCVLTLAGALATSSATGCGGQIAADPGPTPSSTATTPTPVPTVTGTTTTTTTTPIVDAAPDVARDSGPIDAGAPDTGGFPPGTSAVEVNKATNTLTPEGLVLETFATPANPPGGFNGPGAGNKAFLGFSGYDNTLLSALGTIVVRARRDLGTPFFYLNLQVDCDGNGTWEDTVDGIITVDPSALPAIGLDATMTDVTIQPTDPVFKVVGAGMPPGPMKCGLFSHLSATPLPLTSVPASARLWNGDTGDNGMPRGKVMPAVLFVLGDSNNLADRKVTVESVTIGPKLYDLRR